MVRVGGFSVSALVQVYTQLQKLWVDLRSGLHQHANTCTVQCIYVQFG